LDKLIRLEEFLREDLKQGQTKLIVEWVDHVSGADQGGGEGCTAPDFLDTRLI
jgi:hypothetical protein